MTRLATVYIGKQQCVYGGKTKCILELLYILILLLFFSGEKAECIICGFKTKNLRHHMIRHGERKFRCKECNYASKSQETLKHHMRNSHLLKGRKPFQCGHCSYRSAIKGNVTKHIQVQHPGASINIEQVGETLKCSDIKLT